MSGGTLICLAANEIVMSSHAVLGPVDPQLDKFPAASLLKVVEQKPIEKIKDETLVFADVGKKAIAQVRAAVHELLQERLPREKADELAHKLSEGTWTHDYPISAGEAKSLGLNVSTDIPTEIWICSRCTRSRPARRAESNTCQFHGSVRQPVALDGYRLWPNIDEQLARVLHTFELSR
jgi:hypothetical protein